MLKWCSYCQQFLGEVPDYDNFAISHGACPECHAATLEHGDVDLTRPLLLKAVQRKLWTAGLENNLAAAAKVIDDAASTGLRPVDILIGMLAPMLYQVGEDWKKGVLSVEQEHSFTAFCEQVIDLVSTKIKLSTPLNSTSDGAILLMNAPGNVHTLGLRIIALWLASKGKVATILDKQYDAAHLLKRIKTTRTKLLLISVALPAQYNGVNEIVERVAELANPIRPRVVVGGSAVKLGLIPPIRGADLMADISLLS
ncbi:B12-binding domain-containing protein [Bradyrhizobium sp.]|uniref:cobalamin B12-binding domain-containing protein n=1 Tax=Bradyrhizobium sp. TaxID=376 RepID=UPI0027250C7A|nr:cobalamin B12-binding domain-containing protein [Bradyrhizobium sp.]MDO9299517.1 cobalamin B12-binding domain-containing protein [Bradyrhizobium sp.]